MTGGEGQAGPCGHLPRHLRAGPLMLDLFHRDAQAGGRWLRLHPREFAALWLLAEAAPAAVSEDEMLREAWRLDFHPETNRVAVAVCRIRAKLRAAGVCDLVATTACGAYRLLIGDEALDSRAAIGDGEPARATEGGGDAVSRERAGFDRSG